MKKTALFALAVICAAACCNQSRRESKYIIECKYMCPRGYMVVVSNIENRTLLHTFAMGKYFFEHTNPGDTLTINYDCVD